MRENDIDAIFLDAGSSMFYFTGVRWHASERMLAAVLTAHANGSNAIAEASRWTKPD